jgi:serine protease Do
LVRSTAALVAVAIVVGTCAAYPRTTPVVEAVKKARPSIVTIKIPRAGGRDAVGTGVIIDERGYVVTNRHVVGGATSVNLTLADGTALSAEVIASETAKDLAILHIETKRKLTCLKPAPVSDLMVGETVIAIGHPYGYVNTVSTGIISALGRDITMPTGDVLTGLIQTDASINPGNSGGPLLNINGELIGINVALRDGAQGIAFAINAGTVKAMLQRHLSAHKMAGVSHGLSVKEKVLAETGPRQRVVVASCVREACPSLKQGDEILAIADRAVSNGFDVERALWHTKPGQKVSLKVVRAGKEMTMQLTLLPGSESGEIAQAQEGTRKGADRDSVPAGNHD